MGATTVIAGVGAAGALAGGASSLIGSLSGGGGGSAQSDAIITASYIQQAQAMAAADEQRRMLEEARGYMEPFYNAGTNALNRYGGLLNLPGYAPQDPTETLRATPGYNWMMGQGVNALDRSAAAKGMLQSGAQGKALTAYGQGLGDQTYNNYMNRLQGLVSSGQNAGALQGAYGMQAAPQIGNYLTQGAQAVGTGMVGSQMARQSGYGQGLQGLMGGIGTGLGFLNMMPQSGQNWLGNLWGGGNNSFAGATASANWMDPFAGATAY